MVGGCNVVFGAARKEMERAKNVKKGVGVGMARFIALFVKMIYKMSMRLFGLLFRE
jgi:hypothetical protein